MVQMTDFGRERIGSRMQLIILNLHFAMLSVEIFFVLLQIEKKHLTLKMF